MKLRTGWFTAILIILSACSRHGPTVTYILPDGFKGLLLISEDKSVEINPESQRGKYTFLIPTNGHLFVNNLDVTRDWHKDAARYKNGSNIPDIYINANDIGFYALGEVPGKGMYYFVGTESNFDAVRKASNWQNANLGGVLRENQTN